MLVRIDTLAFFHLSFTVCNSLQLLPKHKVVLLKVEIQGKNDCGRCGLIVHLNFKKGF